MCQTSRTALELCKASNLRRNPLLEDSGAFVVTRRDECIYNQLRLGCPVFKRGFNCWASSREIECPDCGASDGCSHYLRHCPALREERFLYAENARKELGEQNQERLSRAQVLGKAPPRVRPWRGLSQAAIGSLPFATLQFVADTRVWLDRLVEGAGGACWPSVNPSVRGRVFRSSNLP